MSGTDLGNGFSISGGPEDDRYGDGSSVRASAEELRAREADDLRRALAGVDFQLEHLRDRRQSGKRDLRRDALDRERLSVLERLRVLEERA